MIALLRVLLPLLFCSLVWAVKGDSKCSSVLCVTAYANETEVTYTLQAKTAVDGLGWMAIGFGNRMANTPMVIVWPSSSASNGFVISQRQASGTVQPSVVASPPRVATPFAGLTTQDSSSVTYAFTVPAGEGTTQELIWAYSTERPSSDAVGASLQQHDERGRFTLNLANDLESETPATTAPSDDEGSTGLTRNQQILAAHAVIATIGFLVILPAGALLARLGRTFTSSWFKGHWIFQWVIGGLFIGVGWILGVAGVAQNNKPHFDTTHKVLGLILLMVYIAQLALGGVIHFFKTPTRTKRPPQNYMHAIIGLLIIALSMFQVHEGFQEEWPRATGRGKFGNGLYIFWVIWVVLLTLLYFGGLTLLKRQFAQEAESLRERQRKMEKNSSV